MKHILNDLSNEEKNSIREQHSGGMRVVTENFSRLLNSKLGDSKPLVAEQSVPAKTPIPTTVSGLANWAVIQKFFKDNWTKTSAPTSYVTPTYLFLGSPKDNNNGYNVDVYQAQIANVGVGQFILPQLYSTITSDGNGNLKGDSPMMAMRNLNSIDKTNGSVQINDVWNSLPKGFEKPITTHVIERSKVLKNSLDEIRKRSDIAQLGGQLTGYAKLVYDTLF
jgi:hypothetical protein